MVERRTKSIKFDGRFFGDVSGAFEGVWRRCYGELRVQHGAVAYRLSRWLNAVSHVLTKRSMQKVARGASLTRHVNQYERATYTTHTPRRTKAPGEIQGDAIKLPRCCSD
jgi:hypothetical protein